MATADLSTVDGWDAARRDFMTLNADAVVKPGDVGRMTLFGAFTME